MSYMQPHERIIVALDVNDINSAIRLVNNLSPHVGIFKIGFEMIYSVMANMLLSSSGDDLYSCLRGIWEFSRTIRRKVFLDVKLCDIPNTVEKASKAIARLKPEMFNIHASAGQEAIKKAVANKGDSKLFGVTVLTSIKREECKDIFGSDVEFKVLDLAHMLLNLGADGIICAPKEGQLIRGMPEFDKLIIACPNIRPSWSLGKDDQDKDRQMTPHQAIISGIDMLVIGRPITNPPPEIGGPVEAAKRIAKEIASAVSCKL